MELRESSFFLIGNIPGRFHSSHLRAFFSHFTEKRGFVCFHFRHRPEQLINQPQAGSSRTADDGRVGKTANTSCCVVAVIRRLGNEFVSLYQNKNWALADGTFLPRRVKIRNLRITAGTSETETDKVDATTERSAAIPWIELKALPEMNPPSVMPQGNVGTPLTTFMELIRTCKLPSHVIKKLQLEFPKSRSNRRYGAVELDYGTRILGGSSKDDETEAVTQGSECTKDSDSEEESIPSDDDHDAEEWERYEAFHDDVDKQERTQERLYEEELEVVWEKGGSGLVFYTDASYWDQQDGDFDEKCSKEDDWDVDMSTYYDYQGGDKDARDLREMAVERRLREGKEVNNQRGLGGFERHTKGIGRKLLTRSGWTEGSGVGVTSQGIAEPLETDGQHPHSKRGLGYRGEKLDRLVPPSKRQRSSRDVIISTVYDKPDEEEDTVLRSAPPRTIKYREHVDFLQGGILKSDRSTDT